MIDINSAYETATIKPSEEARRWGLGTGRCNCGRTISANKVFCLACANVVKASLQKQAQAKADSCK